MTDQPAPVVDAGPPADVYPRRRARRRPAWRLLLAHVRPYRWTLLGGGLLGFFGGLAALAQPLVAKQVVDALGTQRSLLGPVALLTALTVGGALLTAAGTYVLGRTAEGVVLTARQRLISQLLRLPVGAIDRLKPGDLLARVTSDTTLLRSVSTYGLVHSVNAVFMLVACVVLMGVIDLALLAVTLAVLALNGLAVLVVVPRIRRATERSQAAVGGMSSALERSLGSFRTVKAMGAEDREIRSGRSAARRAWHRGVEVAGWTALMEASAGLAVQVSFLAVLGVGGARVAGGDLPVSSLIAFLLYLFLLSEPISALVNGVGQLQAGLAAVTRLGEVQELPVERGAAQPEARSSWSAAPASVAFTDVWFRYRGGDGPWVHRGLSFELPPGGMTAIVGPSGTGKTTVFALLERFYEPQSGTIAVEGRDIGSWPLPDLRAAIGHVDQEADVLAGTHRREPAPGRARGHRRRAGRGAHPHPPRRPARPPAGRAGHPGRPPRRHPLRGRAAAPGHRPGAAAPSPPAAAGRSHLAAGRRERAGPAGPGRGGRPHHHRADDRPPAVHRHQRRPDPGPGGGQGPRLRHPRAAAGRR